MHPTEENSFKSDLLQISGKAGKATLKVSVANVVELTSLDESHKVVFEDESQTGYFYALDVRKTENPIIDVLYIYGVENVADRNEPSQIHTLWSPDGLKAGLWIYSSVHAIYNFENNKGSCRTGFSTMSSEAADTNGMTLPLIRTLRKNRHLTKCWPEVLYGPF